MSITEPINLAPALALGLVLLAFGFASAAIAVLKGRSFLLFGLLGALAPPITVVYAIFMRRKTRCLACREKIWRTSKVCRYCWTPLTIGRRGPRRIPFGINPQ